MHAIDQSYARFFMSESVYLAGLGANKKANWDQTGRSRKFHIFERQFGCSITRDRGEFPEHLALQYPGTMLPHDCANWLTCPSYTAPVEPARSRQSV